MRVDKKETHSTAGTAERAAEVGASGVAATNSAYNSSTSRTLTQATGEIFWLLQAGHENSMSKPELMAITGMTDRELRREIAHERRAGRIIVSDCRGGGYYLPGDVDEAQRFIRTMRKRGYETLRVADAVELALMREIGQSCIMDFFEGNEVE
jgi:hypothetical protein